MDYDDAGDTDGGSPPRYDPPRRGQISSDVPIPGALGAGAAFCAGVVLFALSWITGIQFGGPGLVLVCAAIVWVVGARLAVASHENSHWDKTMTVIVDGQALIPSALCDEEDGRIIVDTANLCMASPRRLRRLPYLSTDLWQPIETGTIRNTSEALSLVAKAVQRHKANGSGAANN